MKAIVIDLTNESGMGVNTLSASLSFRKFIDYASGTAQTGTSSRSAYLKDAIKKMTSKPGLPDLKTVQQTTEFVELMTIVYELLTPSFEQGHKNLWAIGMPQSPVIFFGTDVLYDLITDPQTGEPKSKLLTDDPLIFTDHDKVISLYSLLLERLYGFTNLDYKPLVISIKDKTTNIPRYFRVNIDNRFNDVYPIGTLPDINSGKIQELLTGYGDIGQLLTLLPIDLFHFEGISIITLTDVTTEYALELIKSIVFEKHKFNQQVFYRQITDALRTLTADPGIDFGLIPQILVNDKMVYVNKAAFHSKIIPVQLTANQITEIYLLFANHFIENPGTIFIPGHSSDIRLNEFAATLQDIGVKSYAMLPVYNGPQLVGLLEVYSTQKILLDENLLSKIYPANHLISRVFQNIIDEFRLSIEETIREKFTSVQQAVQWKFEETAWHFLRDSNLNQPAAIEKIVFENVYPLYGAIDIRNSTITRNEAISKDLQLQFKLLIEVVTQLALKPGLLLADEISYKCRLLLEEISAGAGHINEMRIIGFLESAHTFLRHFQKDPSVKCADRLLDQSGPKPIDEQVSLLILEYFESIDPQTGTAYANRRNLEKSMQLINTSVNGALDEFKTQVQPLYPAYFEKFRTDGVEYDIYIGQSIDPEKQFSSIYVKNARLWQLSSMASIARVTHDLIPNMNIPLQTTQLIFVNSNTIDISFRDDERRFDVEGAYNIRYQVIKKRIDKVHIKETGERLTQPGKIAMVYFQNNSVGDYLEYIWFLQAQNVLLDDLEFLELEELQGVSGLKALRIGVNLNPEQKILQQCIVPFILT